MSIIYPNWLGEGVSGGVVATIYVEMFDIELDSEEIILDLTDNSIVIDLSSDELTVELEL